MDYELLVKVLYETKFISDLHNNLTVAVLVSLIFSLGLKYFVISVVELTDCKFRLNIETVYAFTEIITEILYMLAVSLSVVSLILLMKISGDLKNSGTDHLSKFIGNITMNNHVSVIIGMVILVTGGVLFRLFFSYRNLVTNLFDVLISLAVIFFMLYGMVLGSFCYFDFIVN